MGSVMAKKLYVKAKKAFPEVGFFVTQKLRKFRRNYSQSPGIFPQRFFSRNGIQKRHSFRMPCRYFY